LFATVRGLRKSLRKKRVAARRSYRVTPFYGADRAILEIDVNKPERINVDTSVEHVDGGHLRAFVERIERMEEEKRAIADDIKGVYAEAKGNGFDAKIIRKVVALRRMDRDKRIEEETVLDVYLSALGDYVTTPLGRAAVEAVRR
jgi:uncharacterized protein (UPF0335 family)